MGGGNRNKSKKSKKPKIRKIDPKQFDNRRETTTTTNTNTNNKKLTTKQQLQNKVQQRFKDREARGLDGLTGMRKVTDAERKQGKTQLTQYRTAQREQVRNAAIARNAGGTSAQVAKDNAQYGNTVPAGSFNISEAGQAQAAANLAEKRLSAPGTYGTGMPSNPAYKGVGARDTGPVRYKDSDYLTATPYVNAFKRTFGPEGSLIGNRFNPADRAAAQGAGLVDSGVGLFNAFKNMGPQGVLGFGKRIPNVPTLPKFQDANLQALRNFSSVAIPAAMTGGAAGRLNMVGLV